MVRNCCSAGDPGSIPGLGRSPGEVDGHPLHIPAWRIPMDRGSSVHGDTKSQTQLSD